MDDTQVLEESKGFLLKSKKHLFFLDNPCNKYTLLTPSQLEPYSYFGRAVLKRALSMLPDDLIKPDGTQYRPAIDVNIKHER